MPDDQPKPKSWVRKLDEKLRFLDLRVRRTHGGWLSHHGIDRHSPGFAVLAALVCAWMVAGTATLDWRLAYALLTFCAVFTLTLALGRRVQNRLIEADLAVHLGLVTFVAGMVWLLGGDRYLENHLYRHILLPLAMLLVLALGLAAMLARYLFSDLWQKSDYKSYLPRTELFQSYGPDRTTSGIKVLIAAVTAPLRGLLQLLWLPAVVALLIWPDWLTVGIVSAFVLSAGAMIVAGYDDRFDAMWKLLQRGLFRGGALGVSLTVILFGILRVLKVSYVTTILDSAAGQVILFLLAAFYLFSWWTDYWVGRLLAQQVLQIIAKEKKCEAWLPYPIAQPHTSVPADNRLLQIHGSARFLAVRPAPALCDVRFQWHTMQSLIALLADSGAPGGKATPLPSQVQARTYTYFAMVMTFILLLGGMEVWRLNRGIQSEALNAKSRQPSGVSLDKLLFDEKREEGRPLIVMAASGGGTRAALFTASVLRGLWRQNAAADVVFGSGISGGGAALAYFAAKRPQLANASSESPWTEYFDALKAPFIQDVLQRATEWRMAGPGRLGMLLTESFERRWKLPEGRRTLGQVNDFGLILNTSLAGHFDRADAPDKAQGMSLLEAEKRYRKLTRSELAGGRLILTNLRFDEPFALKRLEGHASHALPIIVDDRETRLEAAASLNANFPPVFSDAAVGLDDQSRFWVTDGGAVDNRGMEMLLYSIRQALRLNPNKRLPRMIVLVADSSGLSPLFSQDRGTAPLGAAGAKFASQLASEIVASIQQIYCGVGQGQDFGFTYLFMPDALRTSGSFGTHWMLQPSITIKNEEQPGQIEQVTLKGDQVAEVLRCLYTDAAGCQLSGDATKVRNWALNRIKPGWSDLVEGLRKGGKLPVVEVGTCGSPALAKR